VNQAENRNSRLKARVIRLAKIILGSIAALMLVLYAASFLLEDKIEKWFLQRLNESLSARVEIGEISFSLLRNFPYAGIRLSAVKAYNAKDYPEPGVLLQAEYLDFTFSMWDLISGDYSIRKAKLNNAKLQMLRNTDGKENYDIFKSTDSSATDAKFDFNLKSVEVKNTEFYLNDESVDLTLATRIERCDFSGAFNSESYQMTAEGDVFVYDLKTDKQSWIKEKKLQIDLNTTINKQNDSYTFSKCRVELSKLKFAFDGMYTDGASPHLDFSAAGEDLDIRSLLSLMPSGYEKYIDRYESEGEITATLRLKGKIGNKLRPDLRIDFETEQLSVENTQENIAFERINCKGRFENRLGGYLRFDAFDGILNKGSIKGKGELSNFAHPRFDFDMNAALNLADLQRFIELNPIAQLSGDATIQLRMRANSSQVENFAEGGYRAMQANGSIRINNAAFRIQGDTLPYSGFSGMFRFDGNNVQIPELRGNAGNSDFKLMGNLNNLFGWLFGAQESIGITATVESKLVQLDELFSRKTQKKGKDENYTFRISPRLNLSIKARVGNLKFQRFKANDISGTIRVNGSTLFADKLIFRTMNGRVQLDGSVQPAAKDNLFVQCSAELSNVDIKQLFYECENFGQTVLQDKNLRGKLDASIELSALADGGLNLDAGKVISKANLVINRGELIDFEPLEPLSKYIDLEELRHVKFSQLKNTVEIRNEKIYIPTMDIESSALSLSASGVHSFDNEIEYHIKLLLSDLLARKAKRARKEVEEFGEVEDDGTGKTSLFIAMKGQLDNPSITFDGKGAREKIKSDMAREKQSMKQLLHDEWGLFKRDTTLKKDKEPETKKKNKVLIDFDEDDN
jgi:uncharacterized protein involved in outer membrane biogenesis